MIQHLAPGKILLMNVGAHATLYLAFSFLPYGFGATTPAPSNYRKSSELL